MMNNANHKQHSNLSGAYIVEHIMSNNDYVPYKIYIKLIKKLKKNNRST